MIKSKTVFVVGAGASAEVGLPIGLRLRDKIRECLRLNKSDFNTHIANEVIRNALGQTLSPNESAKMASFIAACDTINASMPLAASIDNFLHTHKSNEKITLCGKLGIAISILEAERKSRLYVDSTNVYNTVKFENIADTWYTEFWRLISTGVDRASVEDIFNNVSFIVFNYDRCVEQFLFEAMKTYYRLDADRAASVVAKLPISRPYGMIGKLPSISNGAGIPFGGSPSGQQLLHIANQIKTFNEQIEAKDELTAIGNEIVSAKKIIFLGFAFHEINMKLLTTGLRTVAQQIFGTVMGISKSDTDVIGSLIRNMLTEADIKQQDAPAVMRNMQLNFLSSNLLDGSCAKLFQEYSRSIGN